MLCLFLVVVVVVELKKIKKKISHSVRIIDSFYSGPVSVCSPQRARQQTTEGELGRLPIILQKLEKVAATTKPRLIPSRYVRTYSCF